MDIEIHSFQQLSHEQLYALLKLRVDVFVVEQNCPYPELDDKDQAALHFLGTEERKLVAYLRLYHKENETAVIGRIVTDKGHRKKGLSSILIKKAMDYITSESTALKIHLQAQEHLVPYYSKFGFDSVSDSYVWDGIPHVDMEYEIGKP